MTQAEKVVQMEKSLTSWLLRFGAAGFIAGYSLTITASAFLIWNLLIASTNAGLSEYWNGPVADSSRNLWPLIYLASLLVATFQWFKYRRSRKAEPSDS